jgi:putative redox protein
MRIKHQGGMKFAARTREHEIVGDLPEDQGGHDAGMTPPEWFLASLGACIGVYMANFCKFKELPYEGMEVEIDLEKAADPPRIGSIRCAIHMPPGFPDNMRESALKVAKQCLIHNTLHHTPHVDIDYVPANKPDLEV